MPRKQKNQIENVKPQVKNPSNVINCIVTINYFNENISSEHMSSID